MLTRLRQCARRLMPPQLAPAQWVVVTATALVSGIAAFALAWLFHHSNQRSRNHG